MAADVDGRRAVSRASIVHSEAGLRETRYATSCANASLRLNIRPFPPRCSFHNGPSTSFSASPSVEVACRPISRSNTVYTIHSEARYRTYSRKGRVPPASAIAPGECSACVCAILVLSRRRVDKGRERSRSGAFEGVARPESGDVLFVSGRSSGGRTMEGVTTVEVPGVGVPVEVDRSGGEG